MEHAKKLLLVDPSIAARATVIDKKLSALDESISEILKGNLPEDEKAKRYAQTLQRLKYFDLIKPKKLDHKEQLIQSLPANAQTQAKQILDMIHPFVSWSDSGELIYKDSIVPYSNIVDLLTSVLQQTSYKDPDPEGWPQFAESLMRAKVPKALIRKAKARAYLVKLEAKDKPPKTIRKASKRSLKRELNWEESE